MVFVCPYCMYGLASDKECCPNCGRMFVSDEWPQEAYASDGMAAVLVFQIQGRVWRSRVTEFVIGRQPGQDGMQLEHLTVSREHVRCSLDEFNHWKATGISRAFQWNGENRDSVILTSGGILTLGSCALKVGIQYMLKPQTDSVHGMLSGVSFISISGLPISATIRVGSGSECEFVVQGTVPVHAFFYQNHRDGSWWVVDCASPSGTRVNSKNIRNYRLDYGDVVTIASVPIRFERNGFAVKKNQGKGLAIEVQNLSTTEGSRQILKNIQMSIKSGEFIGILGPSGCGKSSLIQRLAGLASYSEGNVLMNGIPLNEIREQCLRKTAYLPQQVVLHSQLTLEQEFRCFCQLHTPCFREGVREILPVLKRVGLEKEIHQVIANLSGGQQRRAGIALELLRSPELLFLDEPTAGLDPSSETEIMQYLRRIANQGKTVVCSTHLMDNFETFDKVLLLVHGQVAFYGRPEDLLTYFNVKSPREVFRILSEDSEEQASQFAVSFLESPYSKVQSESRKRTDSIEKTVPVSMWNEICGYLKRYLCEMTSFRNSRTPIRDFCFSRFCILFLLQPFLISQVIKLACAQKFYQNLDVRDVIFFCILSVFWLGLNQAIREFVSERVPHRCLERLEQVSFGSYIVSKLIWTSCLCLIQTWIFSLFFFGLPHFPVVWRSPDSPHELVYVWTFGQSAVLFLVCLLGAWIALAISAFFKNENSAVGMLPIILIPILLFSFSVIKNNDSWQRFYSDTTSDECSPIAVFGEWISPCHPPLVVMNVLREKHRLAENEGTGNARLHARLQNGTLWLCGSSLLWFLVSLFFIIQFQYRNELAWKGR